MLRPAALEKGMQVWPFEKGAVLVVSFYANSVSRRHTIAEDTHGQSAYSGSRVNKRIHGYRVNNSAGLVCESLYD
jgi:hypothetical protein